MKSINRTVSKINIILLIANISVLIAVQFFFPGNTTNENVSHNLNYQMETNHFLKEELDFTDAQYQKYLEMNQQVTEHYQGISEVMCKNHNKYLMELSKPNPSLKAIDSLSRVIGYVHVGLKKYTARHFLNIKSICNPEQEEKLENLIKDMLNIGACSQCEKDSCKHREEPGLSRLEEYN